jgi:hypothetical protein
MHSRSTRDQTNISRQQIENIGAAGGSQTGQEEFRESGLSGEMSYGKSRFLTALSARFGMTKELSFEGMLLL